MWPPGHGRTRISMAKYELSAVNVRRVMDGTSQRTL